MPIHDWSRVDAGILHDLHLGWIDGLRAALNPLEETYTTAFGNLARRFRGVLEA